MKKVVLLILLFAIIGFSVEDEKEAANRSEEQFFKSCLMYGCIGGCGLSSTAFVALMNRLIFSMGLRESEDDGANTGKYIGFAIYSLAPLGGSS